MAEPKNYNFPPTDYLLRSILGSLDKKPKDLAEDLQETSVFPGGYSRVYQKLFNSREGLWLNGVQLKAVLEALKGFYPTDESELEKRNLPPFEVVQNNLIYSSFPEFSSQWREGHPPLKTNHI
jgi:hypothetical protein